MPGSGAALMTFGNPYKDDRPWFLVRLDTCETIANLDYILHFIVFAIPTHEFGHTNLKRGVRRKTDIAL